MHFSTGERSTIKLGRSIRYGLIAVACTLLVLFTSWGVSAEIRWTPKLYLFAVYDDNVFFDRTNDTEEDYIYNVEPRLRIDYQQELTRWQAEGRVLLRRYQDFDELDDENYRFDFDGDTRVSERFKVKGSYEFIKDSTFDSELEETGRIFAREDRFSHKAMLIPNFDVTERLNIGVSGRYRDVEYDSDTKVDYYVWDVGLPIRRKLATEIDTVYIQPGFTRRETDTRRSNSYNFRIGWDRDTTERLNLNFSVGVRYTEDELLATGEEENNWGGLGNLILNYIFETGDLKLDIYHDLLNTANGDLVNVSRVLADLRWYFTERLGVLLRGRYYYTRTEGEDDNTDTQYIEAGPDIFYHLTREHIFFVGYQYSQDYQNDLDTDKRAERNRIWAGFRFNFPL